MGFESAVPEAIADERSVLLIQQGARRNYIYARQLEEAGLLQALACDAAWAQGALPAITKPLTRLLPRLAGQMRRREVCGVPASRIHASLLPNLTAPLKLLMDQERGFAAIDEVLALTLRLRGLAGARVVVNYQGNGGSFLNFAKRSGARIATDFIITPLQLETMREESSRWPGWEDISISKSMIEFYRRRMSHLVEISDLYLCPSRSVARDLSTLMGYDESRLRIVPYGLSGVLLKPAAPEIGRVLFAGSAGLRKGIPYLAEAARMLKSKRPEIEIVVAGSAPSHIRERPETRDLVFLGALSRNQMADELSRADVFCLPSLAEGSATSIYEAMAYALPVVTTLSSGSVVEHGVEGIIVPERNSEAIAEAICTIVDNRTLRQKYSHAALQSAARYSDDACGEIFIAAVRELL